MYTRKKEMQSVADVLIDISEPQEGKFIGAFDLCKIYQQWKRDTLDALTEIASEESQNNSIIMGDWVDSISTFFQDFEENVRGEIVNEVDFSNHDESDIDFLDNRFNMEAVYPNNLIRKTTLQAPKGFTHFMILPVDYNQGDMAEIGIAWLTKKGKKNYSQYLTGDY